MQERVDGYNVAEAKKILSQYKQFNFEAATNIIGAFFKVGHPAMQAITDPFGALKTAAVWSLLLYEIENKEIPPPPSPLRVETNDLTVLNAAYQLVVWDKWQRHKCFPYSQEEMRNSLFEQSDTLFQLKSYSVLR